MFHAFILLLNYDFALQYTTSQIAQAAIEIVGVSPKCLLNTEKVYNQNMYEYLNSFDPQSDMKFFLTKQPIILTKPN